MKAKKANIRPGVKTTTSWKSAMRRDWQLYLMLLFPLAMVFIFNYAAYPGLRMIFMNYIFKKRSNMDSLISGMYLEIKNHYQLIYLDTIKMITLEKLELNK